MEEPYYKYPKLTKKQLGKYEKELEDTNPNILFQYIPTQEEIDVWIKEHKTLLIPDINSRENATYRELLEDFELNDNLEFEAICCL